MGEKQDGVEIRGFQKQDVPQMTDIWNEVVRDGNAFPQEREMSAAQAAEFFASQSYAGVAVRGGVLLGLYILHPNNVGRCGHICNASYAVKKGCRGMHVGERLVRDCMAQAKGLGFRILQFNAVVATNEAAIGLYTRLGFRALGKIAGGFRLPDGSYEDIVPFYIEL